MAIIKPFRGQILPDDLRRVDGIFCEEDDSHWEFCVHAALRFKTYFTPRKTLTGDAIRIATD